MQVLFFQISRFLREFTLTLAAALALLTSANVQELRAQERWNPFEFVSNNIVFHDITNACNGECGFQVFGGRFVDEPMRAVFGVSGYDWVPPNRWDLADSSIIGVALSRPLVSFRDWAEIEAEAGAAQRLGEATSQEIWAVLFFKWKLFPWNRFVKTSLGVSSGLNYAFKLDPLEVKRGDNGEGSHLLHLLTPELSLSLPSHPDTELVFRFHHRSGGGTTIFKDVNNPLFNNTGGGAQYATVGIRFRF